MSLLVNSNLGCGLLFLFPEDVPDFIGEDFEYFLTLWYSLLDDIGNGSSIWCGLWIWNSVIAGLIGSDRPSS